MFPVARVIEQLPKIAVARLNHSRARILFTTEHLKHKRIIQLYHADPDPAVQSGIHLIYGTTVTFQNANSNFSHTV